MKTRKSILLTLIMIGAFAISSCKKDGEDDLAPVASPASVSLIADKVNVNQLEIVTLTSSNISLTQQTYIGTIGGQNVTIAVFESSLGFQIPDLAAGSYTFQTTIEGNAFEINYNVIALVPIANASIYIQAAIPDFTYNATQLADIGSATANMYDASSDAANAIVLNNYVADLQNKINTASPQALDSLARFISANPDLFSTLPDILLDIDTFNLNRANAYVDDLPAYMDAKINIMMKKVVLICAAAVVAQLAGPAGWLISAAIYAGGGAYIYHCNKDLIICLEKAIKQTGELIIADISRTTNTFEKGVQYSFDINSAYSNLNQQDIGSSSPIFASIFSSLNKFEAAWNKMKNILPTFFPGNAFNISNVTTNQSLVFKTRPDLLTITNISNSNVTATIDNSGGILKVTFNSSQTTDQSFTFDIAYDNPNVSSKNSNFSGNVVAPVIITEVTIGTQIWMNKNLDVSTYRNGNPIPQVQDSATWVNLTTGAWCYYQYNDPVYGYTYGKLYNWYAVNDPRGLAPIGWHLPSRTEMEYDSKFFRGI
jgi:hypothetical protein